MVSVFYRRQKLARICAVIFIAVTLIAISTIILYKSPKEEKPSVKRAVSIERISAEEVRLYGFVEVDLNVTATFENPFNPDEVNVTAVITTPHGKVIHLPAFYCQEFRRELAGGKESLTPEGEPFWRVRFTPMETGEHNLYVVLKDDGEAVTSKPLGFNVYRSDDLGFVRLSREDRRYFRFDNNRSFFFIGHNVCWFGSRGTYDYDDWFSVMNLNGENITRIWMAPWAFGIEWKQLGSYDLAEAWRLDYVLKRAEEKGIYVILCLMNHGQLQGGGLTGQWSDNPYTAAKVGPLQKPEDFWANKEAMDLFKGRLRYIVARWGYRPNMLAWEFWNEVELTDHYSFDIVARWHEEMARYLRESDPFGHMITTSSDPKFGGLDSMDFLTIHRYGPESFKDIAGTVSEIIRELWARYGKPVLVTEFGADWRWFDNPYTYRDKEGVEIHNGIWSSILSGSASSAMLWWWDNYIHPYNLYYHYGALSRYLDGINPEKSGFKDIEAKLIFPESIGDEDLADQVVYPSLGWAKPETNRFEINIDGTVSNISQFCSFIQGKTHPELRNNPTFLVDPPSGGEAIVHVNSVATSGAMLEICVDDFMVERVTLSDRDGKNDGSAHEYDMDVKVSVPPGRREIRLDNSGDDWLTIDYVKFTKAVLRDARVRVIGLSNGTLAMVWIQNRDHTWWNVVNNMPIEPIKDARLEFSGFEDGEYQVECWDTYNGTIVKSETALISDGRLGITIQELEKDIALRIHRVS